MNRVIKTREMSYFLFLHIMNDVLLFLLNMLSLGTPRRNGGNCWAIRQEGISAQVRRDT